MVPVPQVGSGTGAVPRSDGKGRTRDSWVEPSKVECLGDARERDGATRLKAGAWGWLLPAVQVSPRGDAWGCTCDPLAAGRRWQACGQQHLAGAGRGPGSCATVAMAPLWSLCNCTRFWVARPQAQPGPRGCPRPHQHRLWPRARSCPPLVTQLTCPACWQHPSHTCGEEEGFHETETLRP